MLNFSISLLMGFMMLVILHRNFGKDDQKEGFSIPLCKLLGRSVMFFFLSTFVWMTIMSYIIFKQIQGMSYTIGGKGINFILKKMLIGYGIPALICFIMMIVEATVERCSPIQPNFGHSNCLFIGKTSKFVWFLLPILIMLLLNTGMFAYIAINICRNQKSSILDSLKTGKRKETLDQICLYLRLFLGMGIIWYFELIGFATDDGSEQKWMWLPDCLNMLQGVWVFLIFVCKRNVLQVVSNRSDRLYSVILERTKSNQPMILKRMLSRQQSKSSRTNDVTDTMGGTEMVSVTSATNVEWDEIEGCIRG